MTVAHDDVFGPIVEISVTDQFDFDYVISIFWLFNKFVCTFKSVLIQLLDTSIQSGNYTILDIILRIFSHIFFKHKKCKIQIIHYFWAEKRFILVI